MSVADDFDFHAELGLDAPCYVRKVDRRTYCGEKNDTPEHRASLIERNVLSKDGGVLSVFYVSSPRDLIRAAVALNFQRTGGARVEDLCFLAFSPEELDGIVKDQTADSFACVWARSHHWNVIFTASDQARIAKVLSGQNRFPNKFTKSRMSRFDAVMRANGCRTVVLESHDCVCEREARAS